MEWLCETCEHDRSDHNPMDYIISPSVCQVCECRQFVYGPAVTQ